MGLSERTRIGAIGTASPITPTAVRTKPISSDTIPKTSPSRGSSLVIASGLSPPGSARKPGGRTRDSSSRGNPEQLFVLACADARPEPRQLGAVAHDDTPAIDPMAGPHGVAAGAASRRRLRGRLRGRPAAIACGLRRASTSGTRESVQRIFVGDVQGCADELAELVDRARGAARRTSSSSGSRGTSSPRTRQPARPSRPFWSSSRRGRGQLRARQPRAPPAARRPRPARPRAQPRLVGDVLGAPDAAEWVDWLLARPLVRPVNVIAGEPFAMLHARLASGLDARAAQRDRRRDPIT